VHVYSWQRSNLRGDHPCKHAVLCDQARQSSLSLINLSPSNLSILHYPYNPPSVVSYFTILQRQIYRISMTPSSNRDDPSVRPQKRPASPELDTLSSATSTPAKKAKINTTAGKTSKKPSPSPSTGTEAKISKGESWGAERRLRLWGAFNACAEIRWEDVAAMVSDTFLRLPGFSAFPT